MQSSFTSIRVLYHLSLHLVSGSFSDLLKLPYDSLILVSTITASIIAEKTEKKDKDVTYTKT